MNLFSQEEWIRTYHENDPALFISIQESYDHGYLLSGWMDRSYPTFCWLLKTDINGYILWEKVIGTPENTTTLMNFTENQLGEIFITGHTYIENEWGGDPYVMKLNACGEREWCNILTTEYNYDNARDVVPTEDGGCIVNLYHRGYENDPNYNGEDRLCLARFDENGYKIWETCYNSTDTLTGNEENKHLLKLPNNKFLVSGHTYYTDSTTGLAWLNCYYILTNGDGEFLWETIVHKDSAGYENGSGGIAWESTLSPGGNYILSSISHYIGANESRPAILKLDMEGNAEIADLVSGNTNGKLWSSELVNDSTVIGSGGWGEDASEDPALALKFDTAGNIINQREVTGDIYLSQVEKTFDNKYLFFTQSDEGPIDHNIHLIKYNQNLEYDSIYNQPMVYDSLCPYPIASDTISLDDCMISVSNEEVVPEPTTYSPELKLYPNPVRGPVTVELPGYIEKHSDQKGFQITQKDYQYHSEAVLHIINIHGQAAATHKVNGEKEMTVPTQDLSPGVYMVVMEVNGKRYAKEKVIVRE